MWFVPRASSALSLSLNSKHIYQAKHLTAHVGQGDHATLLVQELIDQLHHASTCLHWKQSVFQHFEAYFMTYLVSWDLILTDS